MVSNAVKELQASKNQRLTTIRGLEKEIASIEQAINSLSGITGRQATPVTTSATTSTAPKKFVMSPAHKKALKKAQQLRWAKHNATKIIGAKPAKKKTMSAAARKAISEAVKARWAKIHAAKKK